MDDPISTYRENLRHVVRPDVPEERREANSATINDYDALKLRRDLSEYAAYESPTGEHESIALAYIQYIDMVVRDEKKQIVTLYAHTETAVEVLQAAAEGDVETELRIL